LSFCKAQSKFYGSHFALNFFLDLVEAPTFFSAGVVSAKVLLQVVSVATLTVISYFHCVHFRSFNFLFFGTHVITQTQDIRTGVLAGNDAKETKVQKYKRLHKKKRNPYKRAA
jgi:hypothetical protein